MKRWSLPGAEGDGRAELATAVRTGGSPDRRVGLCAARRTTLCVGPARSAPLRPGSSTSLQAHCFSPDGRRSIPTIPAGTCSCATRANPTLAGPDRRRGEDGARRPLSSLSFSPDGALILSASYGMHVRLWETASGRLLADLPVDGENPQAAFHPDGRSLAVDGGQAGALLRDRRPREQTFLSARPHPLTACAVIADGGGLACLARTFGWVARWPCGRWRLRAPAPRAVHRFPGPRPALPALAGVRPAAGCWRSAGRAASRSGARREDVVARWRTDPGSTG